MHTQKHHLRQQIRQQRRALSPATQQRYAQQLAKRVVRQKSFRQAKKIALYLPFDGEIDPQTIIQTAWRMGKKVFIPIVPKHGRQLAFWQYQPHTRCIKNRFGIKEPVKTRRCFLKQLSRVYVPLVAFDAQHYRLGMGGGFYDATFANHSTWHLPKRIGLAYAFQQRKALPREPWDQPLHRVVKIYSRRRSGGSFGRKMAVGHAKTDRNYDFWLHQFVMHRHLPATI